MHYQPPTTNPITTLEGDEMKPVRSDEGTQSDLLRDRDDSANMPLSSSAEIRLGTRQHTGGVNEHKLIDLPTKDGKRQGSTVPS